MSSQVNGDLFSGWNNRECLIATEARAPRLRKACSLHLELPAAGDVIHIVPRGQLQGSGLHLRIEMLGDALEHRYLYLLTGEFLQCLVTGLLPPQHPETAGDRHYAVIAVLQVPVDIEEHPEAGIELDRKSVV